MQRFVSDKRTDLSIEAVQHSDAELRADAQKMERLREQDRQANRERRERERSEREAEAARAQEIQQRLNEQAQADRELRQRGAQSPLYSEF